MKITIKDSGKAETLALIDPKTGVNWIGDFVGNTGATSDGQFVFDDDPESPSYYTYLCSQDTYDWWQSIVKQQQAVDDRVHGLKAEHGYEAVDAVIRSVGNADLEDMPSLIQAALDEVFGTAA
jgi:hypothetical protein